MPTLVVTKTDKGYSTYLWVTEVWEDNTQKFPLRKKWNHYLNRW